MTTGPDLPLFADSSAPPDPAEAKMGFLLRLRARGIADVDLLRALETAPREDFAPFRYRDLALREIAIPLPCGQTMPEPWLVARMIEALKIEPANRVLEIGSGAGYATAILAQLAASVLSLERFQSLAIEASARLHAKGVGNVEIRWADGLAIDPDEGGFDRIIAHGAIEDAPDRFAHLLCEGGLMIAGRRLGATTHVVRLTWADGVFSEEPICEGRLQPLIPGLSLAL